MTTDALARLRALVDETPPGHWPVVPTEDLRAVLDELEDLRRRQEAADRLAEAAKRELRDEMHSDLDLQRALEEYDSLRGQP